MVRLTDALALRPGADLSHDLPAGRGRAGPVGGGAGELELDNWRWPGTIFRQRTGKAMRRDREEVAVRFRPVPHLPFGHTGEELPNVLRFGSSQKTGPLN